MDITEACGTIRRCNDALGLRHPLPTSEAELGHAVRTLKVFLERAKADGKSICELEVADYLLCTAEGMRWVMPFLLSAEGMLAYERRKQMINAHQA